MTDNETVTKTESEPVAKAEKKPEKKPPLSESHPDLDERYLRISALFVEARKVRVSGESIPDGVAREASSLLDWADNLVSQVVEERDVFVKGVTRERNTSAVALR